MNEKYTLIFSDGTVIDGLELNGTNFISQTPVSADDECFRNCSPLIVRYDGCEERHEHTELVHVTKYGDEWWFAFRDISVEELAAEKMRADLDYIAMMNDIDLEGV